MNEFITRLTAALDLRRSAAITPDPETLPKLKSELRASHSLSGQMNRNAFAAPPLGSFGAIVAAASIVLFALVGPDDLTTRPGASALTFARADSGVYVDSVLILPSIEAVLCDSLTSTAADSTAL